MEKNISIERKEFIKKSFTSIKNVTQFCMLIDICQGILYPEFKDRSRIDEYLIKTLAHPKSKNRYHSFEIKKKNGGMRTIHAPEHKLKVVLQCINLMFQTVFTPHSAAYGFVEGKSVVDNADLHCDNNYVFNIDLKDFFPSIEIGRILNRLSLPPFNFNKENIYIKISPTKSPTPVVANDFNVNITKILVSPRRLRGTLYVPIFSSYYLMLKYYLLFSLNWS